MDPFKFTTIAHHGRELLGPVSSETYDELLAQVTLEPPVHDRARVLDVGCGKGEMLVRAMTRFGCEGVGVEPNPTFFAESRMRSRTRVPMRDLTLHALPFERAPVPHGRFDLGICAGALHAFGGYAPALSRLVQLVRSRGWALVGAGYWKREPEDEYLAAFGGTREEMVSLAATLQAPLEHRWRVVTHHLSTAKEWDDYEFDYAAAMRRWLSARPNDADAAAFSERIERWTAAYERWGRDTMGYALILLRH